MPAITGGSGRNERAQEPCEGLMPGFVEMALAAENTTRWRSRASRIAVTISAGKSPDSRIPRIPRRSPA